MDKNETSPVENAPNRDKLCAICYQIDAMLKISLYRIYIIG